MDSRPLEKYCCRSWTNLVQEIENWLPGRSSDPNNLRKQLKNSGLKSGYELLLLPAGAPLSWFPEGEWSLGIIMSFCTSWSLEVSWICLRYRLEARMEEWSVFCCHIITLSIRLQCEFMFHFDQRFNFKDMYICIIYDCMCHWTVWESISVVESRTIRFFF